MALTRTGIGMQSWWVGLIALLVCIGLARAGPGGECAPLEKVTAAACVALVCYCAAFVLTWGLSYGGMFTMGCVGLVVFVVWAPSALVLLLCLPVSAYYAIFPPRRSAEARVTHVGEAKG